MLFRKKIEKSCAYCTKAIKMDENTMVCKHKGPVSVDNFCCRFRYDPFKRIPESPDVEFLSAEENADFSL